MLYTCVLHASSKEQRLKHPQQQQKTIIFTKCVMWEEMESNGGN